MSELHKNDKSERRAEELTTDDINAVLEYLKKRKTQLTSALSAIEESDTNHICTTDPECRLMKTRDGYKPSFNVQTAVEPDNHIIVNFDVTSECADWNLLAAGISGAKDALGVDTLEGVADKGYCSDDDILKCLLNGDTPTIYPNKNQNCRTFKFTRTSDEITAEMLESKDPETLKRCVAAGVLPEVLRRADVVLEICGNSVRAFRNDETGEILTYEQMEEHLQSERKTVKISTEEPLSHCFTRDLETDQVTCPMGQTLFKCGNGNRTNIPAAAHYNRYCRPSACAQCTNKCTIANYRTVTFRPGETSKQTDFYRDGSIKFRPTSHGKFTRITTPGQGSVVLKFYPNQRKLRMRNQVVEHPYGTVKRWNNGYYLLVKGKVKAAAELALMFLSYNIKRALNLLGTQQILTLMNA
jgi:transposase